MSDLASGLGIESTSRPVRYGGLPLHPAFDAPLRCISLVSVCADGDSPRRVPTPDAAPVWPETFVSIGTR